MQLSAWGRWPRLGKARPGIRFNEHIEGDGPTLFAHACKMGLGGIVSNKSASVPTRAPRLELATAQYRDVQPSAISPRPVAERINHGPIGPHTPFEKQGAPKGTRSSQRCR